jgi:hypothetical protein
MMNGAGLPKVVGEFAGVAMVVVVVVVRVVAPRRVLAARRVVVRVVAPRRVLAAKRVVVRVVAAARENKKERTGRRR